MNKDIKFHYEKAISNLKEKFENFKAQNKSFSLKELFEFIYNNELAAVSCYSEVYERNSDCFSNIEYSNWYNHSRRKLDFEISKLTDDLSQKCEISNEQFSKKWLDDNYSSVEISATKSLKDYSLSYQKFLTEYSSICVGANSLVFLIDFLDLKRTETMKTLIKTISEEKKKEQEENKIDLTGMRQELQKTNKKVDSLEDKITTKEQEINDAESDLLKQKRRIEELNEKIKALELDYKEIKD